MSTKDIATRLAAHCQTRNWSAAHKELYAPDAVSIEQEASPAFPKESRGLEAIAKKGETFDSMVEEVYSTTVSQPLIAGDSFALTLTMDLSMKGKGRMTMSEICVYVVEGGKIVSEQFFM